MKVSIIAGQYYKRDDGIGRYSRSLINELGKFDKDVNLDIISSNIQQKTTTHEYILHDLLVAFKLYKYLNAFELEFNYFSKYIKNTYYSNDILKNSNSQIYHAVSPSEAVGAIKLGKRPLITTFHDIIPLIYKNRYIFEKVYFKQYCKLAKNSDIIIADSKKTKADLINILNIPNTKIKMVYPGIDLVKFYPRNKEKSEFKNILFLGGLVKRKGIFETLYAFNKLLKVRKDVRLFYGGTGEEYSALNKEVRKLNISNYVTLLGYIDDNKIEDFYHSADLFIYPSKYEGFGYTPLEAMACGIPVLTSNTSSLPEIVKDSGIIVNPNNIDEIYFELNRLLSNPNLLEKMKKKGLIQSKKFSQEKFGKDILEIYKSLI